VKLIGSWAGERLESGSVDGHGQGRNISLHVCRSDFESVKDWGSESDHSTEQSAV
jgi:hypothetical protein